MAVATAEKLYLSEADARRMLEAAGMMGASDRGKWRSGKILTTLNKLAGVEDTLREPDDRELAKLLGTVIDANNNKVEVVFDDREEIMTETNGHAAVAEAPRKGKKASAKKAAAAPAERKGLDRYGCRVNSTAGLINTAMGTKPRTVAQIAEQTGVSPERVKSHVKFWVKKGKFAVTDKGGYYVPKAE